MDVARMIQDGIFSIVQDTDTKVVEVKEFEDVIWSQVPDHILSFEELIAILIRERTKHFMKEA